MVRLQDNIMELIVIGDAIKMKLLLNSLALVTYIKIHVLYKTLSDIICDFAIPKLIIIFII